MGGLLKGGLYLGELFGINIRVHWSMLAVLAIGASRGAITALVFLILFLTVLLHELGHCFAARALGGEAREILLWPLGGLAFTGDLRSPLRSVLVAAAGPMVHIPLALGCAQALAGLGHPLGLADLNPLGPENYPHSSFLANVLYFSFRLQVELFCLNMLPAYPLDGGQILVGWLASRLELPRAATFCGLLTMAVALVLIAMGEGYILIGGLLGFEGVRLMMAVQSGEIDWHPLARLYATARIIAPSAPREQVQEEYLRPCPHCHQPIHRKAERCSHCDQLVEA